MKTKLLVVIAIFNLFVVVACGPTTQSTMTATAGEIATATAMPVINTRDAVAQASWSEGVSITFDNEGKTFRYQSNGIPSHGFAAQYLIPKDVGSQPFKDNTIDEFNIVNSAEYFKESTVDTEITTLPAYVASATRTSLGRIGVMLSGAQLFNDYEDRALSIVALDDNIVHNHVPFVDECNGHTLVDGTSYHYHGIPTCITKEIDKPGQHSFMIGVLEDGFPVYGAQDKDGVKITNADLDPCSGHFGPTPEFPDGIYHYHLTDDAAPYSVDCYHGEITN